MPPLPTTRTPVPALPAELTEKEAVQRYLKRLFPLPTTAVEIDAASNSLTIQVASTYPWKLGELMLLEAHLAGNLSQWQVALTPPLDTLPEITFRHGSIDLDADSSLALKETGWALTRWQIHRVRLVGSVSKAERRVDKELPVKRAALIAATLKASGIESDIETLPEMAISRLQIIHRAKVMP